ncbi:hypothetical protein E2542_SST06461 [Spatholobus suberectus]|nr:hypothetical protein E2542_SST06461 [Spatholobus suberectus]
MQSPCALVRDGGASTCFLRHRRTVRSRRCAWKALLVCTVPSRTRVVPQTRRRRFDACVENAECRAVDDGHVVWMPPFWSAGNRL